MRHRLTHAETRALIARAQAGDGRAEDVLLRANEGLIVRFLDRHQHAIGTLDVDDLRQELRIGLLLAIRQFDLSRKGTFATYAWSKMRGRLIYAFRANHTIYIPGHVLEDPEKREQMPRVTRSLDEPLPGEDATFGALLPAPGDLEANTLGGETNDLAAAILGALDHADPDDREAFCLYFGLAGEPPRTLPQVARRIGIKSSETASLRVNRAAQAVRKALRDQGHAIPEGKIVLASHTASRRAAEILCLRAAGRTIPEIADRLGLDPIAVKSLLDRQKKQKKGAAP